MKMPQPDAGVIARRGEIIDVLPLNASGKVLKFQLRQRGAALL